MKFSTYTLCRLISALSLALLSLASRAAAPVDEITVGVVPQQAATALAKAWVPLLAEVSQRTGVRLSFKTAPDIPTFEERLKNGEYTIAYMNPYHYTVFSKQAGYRAFAREKGRKLVGIIVVHKNSPIGTLGELTGKIVAFPAPAAFAASILPRGEFSRQNIPIDARFVSSHDSVYRGVAQGSFVAGGGIRRTLEAMDPAIASQLRILTTTPSYVPHAFAAHPKLAQETLDKILTGMRSLDSDDAGRQVLEPLSFKGIEPGADKDWDEIRQLRITLPVGKGEVPLRR
jgi:phosphonate transport system substrate-binding protein